MTTPKCTSWQDISTAPKQGGSRMLGCETGPEILLWDGEYVRLGFWNGRSWDDGDYHADLGEMTHWMPLPPAPQPTPKPESVSP